MRLIDADFEVAHWESVLLNPTPDVTEKDRRTAPYIIDALKMAGTVKDAVEVVRCKNCKYKPMGTGCNHDLEFPVHYKCPCECDDNWYSWMPKDNFFCGNGERKTDE